MESENYEKKRRMLYKVPFVVSMVVIALYLTLIVINPYLAIIVGSIIMILVVYKAYVNFPMAIYALRKIQRVMTTDYFGKIKGDYKGIFHVVLVPAYMEKKVSLYEDKIISVEKSKIADTVAVIFVLEQKDTDAQNLVRELQKKHKNVFMIIHPPEEGVVRGKSSAMAYAGKLVGAAKYGRVPYFPEKANQATININMETFRSLSELLDSKEVVVHDTDIDYWFPHNYFEYFTHTYLNTKNRKYKIYQPIIALINNSDKVRYFSRNIALSTTYESINSNFSALMKSPFSAYALSLDLLDSAGYWRPDVIQEDSALYWKIRMRFGRKMVKVKPLAIPVFGNAIEAPSWKEEFSSQWKQLARWGIGTSDMADIWLSDAPLREKLFSIPAWMKFHLGWETTGIIGGLSMLLSMAVNYSPFPAVIFFGSYLLTLFGMSFSTRILEDLETREKRYIFEDNEDMPLIVSSPEVEVGYPVLFESRFPGTLVSRETVASTAIMVVTESSKRMLFWIDLGYIAALTLSSICALHGAYRAFKYDLNYVVAPK